MKHLRVAALHRGTTNVRCRARRSLAVKRLLISRGIRRVAAQAAKRAAVPAACSAACSAVTKSRFQNRYNPGLARPAVRLDDTMAATLTLQSVGHSAPFSSTGGRPIHANGEQAVGTQRAAGYIYSYIYIYLVKYAGSFIIVTLDPILVTIGTPCANFTIHLHAQYQ